MSKKLSEGNSSSKKTEKKKKKTVYGTYREDRKTPKYVSSENYKDGLTDEEVNERIENLQVNIEGRVESKFTKNFKLVFKVITKNTFTFFNIFYFYPKIRFQDLQISYFHQEVYCVIVASIRFFTSAAISVVFISLYSS